MSFPEKPEGKKMGRPKGSRNKVTLMKLAAETAVRENNIDRMLEVCNLIIDQALQGDGPSQKLVWQSVVSNGVSDEAKGTEKVSISINTTPPKEEKVIDHEAIK